MIAMIVFQSYFSLIKSIILTQVVGITDLSFNPILVWLNPGMGSR